MLFRYSLSPVFLSSSQSLHTSFHIGAFTNWLNPEAPSSLPDRFAMGGPSSVRGYEAHGIGPRDRGINKLRSSKFYGIRIQEYPKSLRIPGTNILLQKCFQSQFILFSKFLLLFIYAKVVFFFLIYFFSTSLSGDALGSDVIAEAKVALECEAAHDLLAAVGARTCVYACLGNGMTMQGLEFL